MKVEELIELVEEVMDLDEGTVSVDDVLEDYEEWDSLAKLSLMAAAKKDFGVALSAADVKLFETVKDICKFFGAE